MVAKKQKTKLIVEIPIDLSRKLKEAILIQKGDIKKGDISEFVIKNLEKEVNKILEQKQKH